MAWMSKAQGAPAGGPAAYMRAVAARIAEHLDERPPIDVSSPEAFLVSVADAGLIRLEHRPEASTERVDPVEALGDGPVAFGEDVDVADLEADVFESLSDARDEDVGDAEEA